MKKAIDLAKKIKKEIEGNHRDAIEEINLHSIFGPVFKLGYSQKHANAIICFVIMAYDNDSQWIDTRKERVQNKKDIIIGLGSDPNQFPFKDIVDFDNDDVQEIIHSYLIRQTDHRWEEVMSLLDYASKMILFANKKTIEKKIVDTVKKEDDSIEDIYEYLDEGEIAKINKEKGDLLQKAIAARATADEILKKMESEFQKVDYATQSDFEFRFADVQKFDVKNWAHRVKKRKYSNH